MENVEFLPIHENCEGCNKIITRDGVAGCKAYINPSNWFRTGSCPLQSRNQITIADITQMALKEKIFKNEGGVFWYNGRKVAINVSGLTKMIKSNNMIFADLKKRLGLIDDQGKVRVGQQKQRKH